MLTRIEGVQLAVPDAAAAAAGWIGLLGAEADGDVRIAALGARASRYRVGRGWVELLEPDGAGPVATAVDRRGAHLFAAAASTPDVEALARRVPDAMVDGDRVYLSEGDTGGHGLRVVVVPESADDAVGDLDEFYEVTNLVADAPGACRQYAEVFGLDEAAFCPIDSEAYGYAGALTLFDPDRLHRFEVITPTDPAKTMGRFFGRFGESLYMCFAETTAIDLIAGRAADRGAGATPVRDRHGIHTLFLHPSALGGVMVGLSRPTYAWTWSGHPERVTAP